MSRTSLIVATLALALVACSKNKEDAAGKAGSAAPAAKPTEVETPAKHDTTLPPFAAQWDMPRRTAAWQGAWAGEGFSIGDDAAWEIKGDDITFVNKKGEQHFKLTVDSPCTAGFSAKSADGSSGWTSVYTLDKDGALVTGLGDAGSRKGDQAVVCGGGEVWVYDGKTCTDWGNHFGSWESKPGECGFKKDDKGAEVFFYKDMSGYESKVPIDGDVIWSEQLSRVHAKKHPDLAAAKAAQKL